MRVPANRSRVKENARAAKRGESRAFGVPLIPADQRADPANRRVKALKTEIARGEVELLVVSRIVRDVHLAIESGHLSLCVDDCRAVVVEAGRSAFEDR